VRPHRGRGQGDGAAQPGPGGARHRLGLVRLRWLTYRWYNDHQLPAELAGGTITVRLHGNDEDTRRRFNRTENVRPIAPTDPDFSRLFRIRNDAESINRGLEDTLYLRRAHSVGHRRQLVNLLGWALVINSVAVREHTLHAAEPSAA